VVRVSNWHPEKMLGHDGVHPNLRGHARLTQAVVDADWRRRLSEP